MAPDQHLHHRWETTVIDADWATYVDTDILVPTDDEEEELEDGGLPP